MKTKKTKLQTAARNNYGYIDVTPGTDMTGRFGSISESTINKYIRLGWIKRVGSGLVLTKMGYREGI